MAFVGITTAETVIAADSRSGAGFTVTGPLSCTDTERDQRLVNLGKVCAVIVADDHLWAQIQPLIGKDASVSITEPVS